MANAPETLPRGSSTALDPVDLAERLARAEKEIEELRTRASSENLQPESPRGSSGNVRTTPSRGTETVRGSSENLRPSGSRTIEIVSVLGRDSDLLTPAPVLLTPAPELLTPAPVLLTPAPELLTPAPEFEGRATNRLPSQHDDIDEVIDQVIDERFTDRMTSAAENEATATDVLTATDVDAIDNHA